MYEKEMRKCFKLAKKGLGKVSPNPLVGCVVLNSKGEEITSGYHKKYGENHAERDALLKVDKSQTQGGTLIVNLEPCNHYGKTPPCSDLIIEYGIKKVVIANLDTNPKASGGIEKLKSAGIEIITGVLEQEGVFLNRIFFKNINKSMPYVVTKIATTIDGKIATKSGDSKWITSEKSRNVVKQMRRRYDAILTSSATVLADNPEMLHKYKIILDRENKLDFSMKIFQQGQIILVTSRNVTTQLPSNIQILKVREENNKLILTEVLEQIYQLGIKSVFVEAGGKLNGDLIKNELVDELIHFTAPKILNDNAGMSCFDGDSTDLMKNTKNLQLIELRCLSPDYYARYMFNRIE